MATVINNPSTGAGADTGSGMGFLIGVLMFALLAFLFFFYGVPALRGLSRSASPQITVPDKIDVNVNGNAGSGQGGQ